MKFFQFFTFTLLAAISAALLIVGMATLHWVTSDNSANLVTGTQGQSHFGLRRWYTDDINGDSTDSRRFDRGNCGGSGVSGANQCDLWQSGSWGLGWGIGALACIALAFVMVALISCVTLFRGTWGKFTAAFLMFLAFAATLVGALTYWSHLPNLSDSDSHLSWSFILYCIGGGVALLASIMLCLLPNRHYYTTKTTVVTAPTVYASNTTTTTTTYPATTGAVATTAYPATTTAYPTYPVGTEMHAVTQPLTPKHPGYMHSSQTAYPVDQQPVSIVVQ